MTVDYIRNPRPKRSKPSSIAKANRLGFQLAFIPADNKFPGPGEDRAAVHTESHKVCTCFVAVARCGSPARFAVELLIEHQPIVAIIIKIAMAAVTARRITRSLSAPNNLTAIFFFPVTPKSLSSHCKFPYFLGWQVTTHPSIGTPNFLPSY